MSSTLHSLTLSSSAVVPHLLVTLCRLTTRLLILAYTFVILFFLCAFRSFFFVEILSHIIHSSRLLAREKDEKLKMHLSFSPSSSVNFPSNPLSNATRPCYIPSINLTCKRSESEQKRATSHRIRTSLKSPLPTSRPCRNASRVLLDSIRYLSPHIRAINHFSDSTKLVSCASFSSFSADKVTCDDRVRFHVDRPFDLTTTYGLWSKCDDNPWSNSLPPSSLLTNSTLDPSQAIRTTSGPGSFTCRPFPDREQDCSNRRLVVSVGERAWGSISSMRRGLEGDVEVQEARGRLEGTEWGLCESWLTARFVLSPLSPMQ